MKAKIESCTKDTRTTQGGVLHTGIKINGQWYNIAGDHRDLYGKEVDVEIKGKWAILIEARAPTDSHQPDSHNGGNRIAWEDYISAVREAHVIALELEPDDQGEHICERSRARAALVNTMMIALKDGKLALPSSEEPPQDDNPFKD